MSDRYKPSRRSTLPAKDPLARRRDLKIAFLRLCRAVGLFSIARRITAHRWRILCYHGFSIGDQHEFGPILFMRPEVFRRRLETLRRLKMPIISLDEGLQRLASGSITDAPVSITIDDGWKTTYSEAAPILREFGFPACVYVTTYYCERQVAVFNVVVWYMLWKTQLERVTFEGIHPELDGGYDLSGDRDAVGHRWIATLEANFDSNQREAVLGRMAQALRLDIAQVLDRDRFRLMSRDEITALVKQYKLDVQLHTHRHRLPQESAELMTREIEENRRVLEQLTSIPGVHFCYPSGVYFGEHPQWLARAGIRSATTCDAGTNDSSASPLLLRRYLDRDDWSDIEFEAVTVGFSELASDVRRACRSLLGRKAPTRTTAMKDAAIG